MLQQLLPALKMTVLLTVITGLLYPGIVTGFCQVFFKDQANGSLIKRHSQVIGSSLLGQNFSKPEYFHGRPSAAGSDGYDPSASSGSNWGPTSQKLYDRVKTSANEFRKDNPSFKGSIPADALTASGSGLDPDISLANAQAQMARVAQARGADQAVIGKLIKVGTENRNLGWLGEPRVNVLLLNLALDEHFPKH